MEGLRQAGLAFGAQGALGPRGLSVMEVIKHGGFWSKEVREAEMGEGIQGALLPGKGARKVEDRSKQGREVSLLG